MKAATGPEPAGGQHDQRETWKAVPMPTQGDRRGIPAGADPDKVPAAEHLLCTASSAGDPRSVTAPNGGYVCGLSRRIDHAA